MQPCVNACIYTKVPYHTEHFQHSAWWLLQSDWSLLHFSKWSLLQDWAWPMVSTSETAFHSAMLIASLRLVWVPKSTVSPKSIQLEHWRCASLLQCLLPFLYILFIIKYHFLGSGKLWKRHIFSHVSCHLCCCEVLFQWMIAWNQLYCSFVVLFQVI